jgi:hypothetical protein
MTPAAAPKNRLDFDPHQFLGTIGEGRKFVLFPKKQTILMGLVQRLCGLNLFEPWLAESHTTVVIPFDDRVIFVSLLHRAKFSSRLSKIAQPFDAISGNQFLIGGRGLSERWLLGTV